MRSLLVMSLLAIPVVAAPAPTAVQQANALLDKLVDQVEKRWEAHLASGKPESSYQADVKQEWAELDARLAAAKKKDLRQALLLARFVFGSQYAFKSGESEPSKAQMQELLRDVPPTSTAWEVAASPRDLFAFLSAPFWDPSMSEASLAALVKRAAWIKDARAHSPIPGIRAHLWSLEIKGLIRKDALREAKTLYEKLQKEYVGDPSLAELEKEMAKIAQLAPGTPFPDFAYVDIENSDRMLTKADFQGKYLLIHFWNAEFTLPTRGKQQDKQTKADPFSNNGDRNKQLHAAWKRFKDRNVAFLSISTDSAPENVLNTKARLAAPMPWPQGFANDVNSEGSPAHLCLFNSVQPKLVLLDPEGKIITAQSSDLMGPALETTLAKYLDK